MHMCVPDAEKILSNLSFPQRHLPDQRTKANGDISQIRELK